MSHPANHRRIHTEPCWRQEARFTASDLPRDTRNWLLDDGSLTERLASLGTFRVQRLWQGWQVPLPSEQQLLGQSMRRLALVREVMLLVDEAAVVFARSVFPASSLTGSLTHLRRLRNSSLGAILFAHPGMHRSPFELARVDGSCDYLPAHLHQADPAWGRRSRFEIEGKRLMVSEVFLQGFRPWPLATPIHRTRRGVVDATIVRAKQ